jgi:hypothetical protein
MVHSLSRNWTGYVSVENAANNMVEGNWVTVANRANRHVVSGRVPRSTQGHTFFASPCITSAIPATYFHMSNTVVGTLAEETPRQLHF